MDNPYTNHVKGSPVVILLHKLVFALSCLVRDKFRVVTQLLSTIFF